jgi:long-chain acyl-CoA synthetase
MSRRSRLPGTAVVKLTSGSTGEARGIATPAGALEADEEALYRTMGLAESDRYLAAIPLSHSYGLSSLAVPALRRGSPLVLPEDEGPFSTLLAAASCSATVFPTVPSYLDALAMQTAPPRLPDSLRLIVSAGAPLAPDTAVRFRERFGRPVHVFYGASECGGICYDREGSAGERGTVGTPVEGVTVRLREEPSTGPAGGTIAVSSHAVAAGYVPGPNERLANGTYVTGDIGAWRGGELALLGRSGEAINVKGKKVNPREVESVLSRLDGVKEVVVVGLERPGGGSDVVRAVIACDRERVTYERVMDWCRSRLPAHKVPRSVLLLDTLPRTGRGKLDRTVLLAPDPAGSHESTP